MTTRLLSALFAIFVFVAVASADPPQTPIGISGTISGIVLPGPELEAKPITDRKAPIVLRVVAVYPHGTDFRYDLEYYGLEAGTFDLKNFLRRKDGPVGIQLPPIPVTIVAALPAGMVKPHELEIQPSPRLGGYRILMYSLLGVWVVGLLAIVASFFFPRTKRTSATSGVMVSVADKLRPLVAGALAGKLSHTELAGLERGLLALWRKRLNLEGTDPEEAMTALRNHADAGPLLGRLEQWLHRPGTPEPVDVPSLLAPYQNIAADALELPGGAA